MTDTRAPDIGFFAAIMAKTKQVFLDHYSKVLTALIAAVSGWAMVYGTAWVNWLPTPPPPPVPAVIRDDPAMVAKLEAIEAMLKELKDKTAKPKKAAPK